MHAKPLDAAHKRTCSVIIEWENALLSELGRACDMLRILHVQLTDQSSRLDAEVIILHDPARVDREVIEQALARVGGSGAWPAELRLEAVSGLSYFDLKNHGFGQSCGDLIVFLDSDVVPEDGWLGFLVDAFEDPDVQVVGGMTYIKLESFYSRAFAAFWFFPPRTESSGLNRDSNFLTNNVVFRRAVFSAHPFPRAPTFRGQGTMLARELTAAGITIHRQTKARVHHPPPNGIRHFVNRAICHGYDRFHRVKMDRTAVPFLYPLRALGRFLIKPVRNAKLIASRAQPVGLGNWAAVAAWGLSLVYEGFVLFGSFAALAAPRWVRRHFAI